MSHRDGVDTDRPLGWCSTCEKLLYRTRKHARKVARQHQDSHKGAYRCEVTGLWHVGTVGREIIAGLIDRATIYGSRAS